MKIRDMRTYYEDVQKGARILKTMRLAVCALARNCEKTIERNIKRLRALKKHCADLRLYVIENDSSDNTRAVLQKHVCSSALPVRLYNVSICKEAHAHFTEGVSYDLDELMSSNDRLLTENRMKRMALLRDGLLYAVKKDGFVPDVLMQIDIDVHWFDIRGIIHSFAHYNTWDALNANGRMFTFCQYAAVYDLFFDSYAFCSYNCERTWGLNSQLHNQYVYAPLAKTQPLYPVRSACGGLSLQKYSLIANESYYKSAEAKDFACCEHISWYESLIEKYGARIYVNPALVVHYNAFWKAFVYAVGIKKIAYKGLFWKCAIKVLRVLSLPLIYTLKLFIKRRHKQT